MPGKLYEFIGDNTKTYLGVGHVLYISRGRIDEEYDRIVNLYVETKLITGDIILVCSDEKPYMFSSEDTELDRNWAQLILLGDKTYTLKTRCYKDLFKILE